MERIIIGLENGNPVDAEPYKSAKRKVFNGLGLKVTVTASSEDLADASVEILIMK